MATDNRTLMSRFVNEIWSRGDKSVVNELLSRDFVRYEPGDPQAYRGPEGLKQRVDFYRKAFPDLVVTIDDMVVEGDKGAVLWTARGTHRGPLGHIPATGKNVTTPGISMIRFRNGKIEEERGIWDTLGFAQQLGAIPEELAHKA
jgi:steroid delta-isomerase-like uncharacterized protein